MSTSNTSPLSADLVTGHGITLPADIKATSDPFDVFIYAASISPDLAADVEATMTDLEVEAVPTAEPRQAGTHSIGYANKPGKAEALADADAGAIITSLAPLALALRARPLPN